MTVMVQLEPTLKARLLAETTSTDFEAGLDELAEGSERLPVLLPEAYRRDGIYGDD